MVRTEEYTVMERSGFIKFDTPHAGFKLAPSKHELKAMVVSEIPQITSEEGVSTVGSSEGSSRKESEEFSDKQGEETEIAREEDKLQRH